MEVEATGVGEGLHACGRGRRVEVSLQWGATLPATNTEASLSAPFARKVYLPSCSGPILGKMSLCTAPCFTICTPGKSVIWGPRGGRECECFPLAPFLLGPFPWPCSPPPCHPSATRLPPSRRSVLRTAPRGSRWPRARRTSRSSPWPDALGRKGAEALGRARCAASIKIICGEQEVWKWSVGNWAMVSVGMGANR